MSKSLVNTIVWGFALFSLASTITAFFELFIGRGITSITLWGIPVNLVIYILACTVHFGLLRRRGDHDWNVQQIDFCVNLRKKMDRTYR